MEYRFIPKPELLHTLRPDIAQYAGEIVSVESWRPISESMAKLFPDDSLMGFVNHPFIGDIPASELQSLIK